MIINLSSSLRLMSFSCRDDADKQAGQQHNSGFEPWLTLTQISQAVAINAKAHQFGSYGKKDDFCWHLRFFIGNALHEESRGMKAIDR